MSYISECIGSPRVDGSRVLTYSYSTDTNNECDLAVLESFACSSVVCIHLVAIPVQSQMIHTHPSLPGVSFTSRETVPPVAAIAVTSTLNYCHTRGGLVPTKCSGSETLRSQGYGLSKEVLPKHSISKSAHQADTASLRCFPQSARRRPEAAETGRAPSRRPSCYSGTPSSSRGACSLCCLSERL